MVLSIVFCGQPHSAAPVCSATQLSNLAVKSYVYAWVSQTATSAASTTQPCCTFNAEAEAVTFRGSLRGCNTSGSVRRTADTVELKVKESRR